MGASEPGPDKRGSGFGDTGLAGSVVAETVASPGPIAVGEGAAGRWLRSSMSTTISTIRAIRIPANKTRMAAPTPPDRRGFAGEVDSCGRIFMPL